MRETVKLILDTDIGCDCDDAGAMAVMHVLADMGECEILAVTHCTSRDDGPGCLDAINHYYGRRDIPVGTLKEKGLLDTPDYRKYAGQVRQEYPNRFKDETFCEDAVHVLRKILVDGDDNSIVIAAIGPLRNMRLLLQSGPDDISPLTGRELIQLKVKLLCVMGGYFPKPGEEIWFGDTRMDAEWNIYNDIPSAQAVASQWPSKIVFCPYEIGNKIKTGGRLITESDNQNPVRRCYELYCNTSRESWDPCTVLFAVRGADGMWDLSPSGQIVFDDSGVNTFTEASDGNHTYMKELLDPKKIEILLDDLMMKKPAI